MKVFISSSLSLIASRLLLLLWILGLTTESFSAFPVFGIFIFLFCLPRPPAKSVPFFLRFFFPAYGHPTLSFRPLKHKRESFVLSFSLISHQSLTLCSSRGKPYHGGSTLLFQLKSEREREACESSKKQSSVRPLKEKESLSPSLIKGSF